MTVDLQMVGIDLDPSSPTFSGPEYLEMLQDLQGNILQSHGRDFAQHLFLRFDTANLDAVRAWIRGPLAEMVTTALDHTQAVQARRAAAAEGNAAAVDGGLFTTFGLSAAGYAALGVAAVPDDPSFLRGAKHPDPAAPLGLNDPPVSAWEAGFQEEIHAVVLLADDHEETLTAAVAQLEQQLAGVATVVAQEDGAVLRNAQGEPIEPFGFADGVSQPLFMATDIEKARLNGGLDRYDPSAPLGLVLLKDPGGGASGYGSYFVFRKLEQDVEGFHKQEAELQQALPADAHPELAGAYVVGRFRDGTPVVEQPVPGWTNEPLNFDYDADVDGLRCPFQAHIRKVNPRGDKLRQFGLPPGEDRTRRIARRAVPFPIAGAATPAGTPVGLLFVCAQSSIVHQFEFIQAIWSNFTEFLRPGTGLDGLIGQAPEGTTPAPQEWPTDWGVAAGATVKAPFSGWVTLKGAEYFFLPSMSFLQGLPVPAAA